MNPILESRNGLTKEYTTMTYHVTHLSNVDNVGPVDRANRIIVGTTIIMLPVLFTAIPPAAIASLVALGTYVGLTGFIGWDPLYTVTKALQQRAPAQPAPMVVAQQQQEEQPAADSYKKAA
jgi:hypothetical protein